MSAEKFDDEKYGAGDIVSNVAYDAEATKGSQDLNAFGQRQNEHLERGLKARHVA